MSVILLAILLPTIMCGCKVYKKDIIQGSHIEKETLTQLKPNMQRNQVEAILGTPALSPFLDANRLEYYQYIEPGNGGPVLEKQLSLFFENNQLRSYSGDWNIPQLPKRR